MNEQPISALDKAGSQTLQVIAKATRFNQWMYESFRKHLKGHVLEIGSGIGNISSFVIAAGMPVTLSDFNPDYFNWLKKKFGHYKNVREILQINLLHPDFINEYGRLKEKYDSIFLLNVIEHLKDDETAIENCRYLLKPRGHLIVLAPAYQFLYCSLDKELGHFKRYSLNTMDQLLKKKGMDMIARKYYNFIGLAGWFFFGKLLGEKMISPGQVNVFNNLVPLAKWVDKIVFRKAGLSVIVTAKKK
jgi:2-polyprenyl-3-methyl-5-hydroxy-6-metoxy-1,4-benzoquinol methylase